MKKIAEKSTQISAKVPSEYAELLDQLAVEDGSNRARHIRLAVGDYLQRHGKIGTLFDALPERSAD